MTPSRLALLRDPFKIDGPTCISFSGGRTSAYMLWRVLQSNGGKLPDECIVAFANTGKEEEQTLEFVRECETRWSVPIVWVEYRPDAPGYAIVNFETASRNGEPFEALIRKRQYLPNPVTRFCTIDLKIRVVAKHLRDKGLLTDGIDMAIGIRADEPRRVAKMRANNNSESVKISNIVPLADANVGVQDVIAFWDAAPFNLALPTYKGRTLAGNCDLCFLKPAKQVLSLIQQRPSRAVWWAKQEAYAAANFKSNRLHGPGTGWFFSMDRPSYAAMASNVVDQATLFDPSEEGAACFCGE